MDSAIQAVPATERQSPEFVLRVIDGLLDTADGEYRATIANDKIVEVNEYQDFRGFGQITLQKHSVHRLKPVGAQTSHVFATLSIKRQSSTLFSL